MARIREKQILLSYSSSVLALNVKVLAKPKLVSLRKPTKTPDTTFLALVVQP